MKVKVRNRLTDAIQFTAKTDASHDAPRSAKVGLAVRWAIENGADLSGADLRWTDLSGVWGGDLAIAETRILPEGDIVGWKALQDGVIAKLLIPANAKRSNAFGRKCWAEFADVLEVHGGVVGYSRHDKSFEYRVGARVTPHEWCDDWQEECAGGIHFFITREEAENWL